MIFTISSNLFRFFHSLLTTIAASLSVALRTGHLIDETRRRVADLGTINAVGEAITAQLEVEPLLALVGERSREAFEAWTESESFKKAHAQARAPSGTYLGHPVFEGFEVIL